MDTAQLRYPVAYWDGTPPQHRITCIAVSSNRQKLLTTTSVKPTSIANTDADKQQQTQTETKQFVMTGSTTGEIVLWEVQPSISTSSSPGRSFLPRALLLRQGSARLTCAVRCAFHDVSAFVVGSVEGFLSLWTATGGKCIKSSLVLPFAPSSLTTYQREVRVKIGRVTSPVPAQCRVGRRRTIIKTYVCAFSAQSPYVYLVSLPHLKTVKILKHDYEVAHITIGLVSVKKPAAPTATQTQTGKAVPSTDSTNATTTTTKTDNASGSLKPTTMTTSIRSVLHCLTIGGTLHRWDLSDLTAPDSNATANCAPFQPLAALPSPSLSAPSSAPPAPEDRHNKEILVTKSKTPMIKLPFPCLAFNTRTLPKSAAPSPYFPVSCSLSASGNLMLIALQHHFCIHSLICKQLETPVLPISLLWDDTNDGSSYSSFAGCQFMPSFSLQGVLVLRLLLWRTDGHIALVSISSNSPALAATVQPPSTSTPAPASSVDGSTAETGATSAIAPREEQDLRKKLLIQVLARFQLPAKQQSSSDNSTASNHNHHSNSISRNDDGYDEFDDDHLPSTVMLDGTRIVAGNNVGELLEWNISNSWVQSPPAANYVNPFISIPSYIEMPAYPTSTLTFHVHVLTEPAVAIVSPASISAVASAFPRDTQAISIAEPAADRCTASVLLTEGSGKAVLLARGFQSGLIRIFGPATRSPASPAPVPLSGSSPGVVKNIAFTFNTSPSPLTGSSPSSSPPSSPNHSRRRSSVISLEHSIIDLTAHHGAITCLLSIGGREFSCHHALMASGSLDMTVCIWDVSNAALLKKLRLSYPVSSLHRPALTEDDYHYPIEKMQTGDAALQESRIKEEYQQTMENKPFTSTDVIVRGSSGGGYEDITIQTAEQFSPPESPLPDSLSGTAEEEGTGQVSAGRGVLFVSCTDHSLRVYSLLDYVLLQTFRGHDDGILTVFRDMSCIKAEQVIVQTDKHSVYVWSMVDGSLSSYVTGDHGALPFLQYRGLIAPGSQLSILAHHIRQRQKRIQQSHTQAYQQNHPHREEEKREARDTTDTTTSSGTATGGSGQGSTAAEGSSSSKQDDEKENGMIEKAGAGLRDRFHQLRTKPLSHSTSFSAPPNAPTSPRGSSGPSLRVSTVVMNSVHSQHVPSLPSLQHPASSFLQSYRPIDRATQHLMLSAMMNTVSSSAGSEQSAGNSNAANHVESEQQTLSIPILSREGSAHTLRSNSGQLPKPTLLKRASTIMASDKDKDDTHDSNLSASSNNSSTSSTSASVSAVPVDINAHDLQMPLVDPVLGTKKLKHTIDAVRVDGKAHLHLQLFIINLNRFIHDLEKRYSSSSTSSGLSSRSQSPHNLSSSSASNIAEAALTPHQPSEQHLAVEALDPTPQEELNYLLSTLFDWDDTSPTTQMLREHFLVHSPFPLPAYAVITDNSQALSILFPTYCHSFRRWQLDPDMTARQALAIAAVCMPLLASVDETSQTYFSKIVAHYNSLLPIRLPTYVEPDISVLALFAVNSNEHVQSSARLLLQGLIERATGEKRREWMDTWSLYYTYPLALGSSEKGDKDSTAATGRPSVLLSPKKRGDASPPPTRSSTTITAGIGYVSDQELMTASVLTFIGLTEISHNKYSSRHDASPLPSVNDQNHASTGVNTPAESKEDQEELIREETLTMFDEVAGHIANTLSRVLSWTGSNHANDVIKCTLAADLLSRALPLFVSHLHKPESIIHRLYLLSMSKHSLLSSTAERCMLEYGKIDPQSFLNCMSKEALSNRNSPIVRQSAFKGISSLVKRHSLSLAAHLPSAVSVCVKCIHPDEPTVRRTLMNSSLAALHALVQQYPTVAFHQGTQKFGVVINAPNKPPSILVYDLKTAEKFKQIQEAHKADIHAIAFSAHGGLLASYSAYDQPPSLKVWTVGDQHSGGLLGLASKLMSTSTGDKLCVKSWSLSSVARPSEANGYYRDAHTAVVLKWAEEEDRGFKLKRSRSYKGSGNNTPTSSTTAATQLPSPAKKEQADAEDTSTQQEGGSSTITDVSSSAEDVEMVQQLVLKCLLSIKLEWKDDTTLTLIRENGTKKSYSMQ